MTNHPYLRAYMAGILLPTWFLLVVLTGILFFRSTGMFPAAMDRAVIFPMAIVPNLWGVWNVLYFALRVRLPLGVFGAFLPVILVPAGVGLDHLLELHLYNLHEALYVMPVGIAVYFLAWKFGVAFCNRVAGLR